VNVSTGPNPQPPTTVPDVLDHPQADAVRNLRAAGFRVLVLFRQTSNRAQDGFVVDEQPRPGSGIPRGSQVTIFIGRFG
jgi:beta-lactam-binding protein with PASTA domain